MHCPHCKGQCMSTEEDTDATLGLVTARLSQSGQPTVGKGFPYHMCCPWPRSWAEIQEVTLAIMVVLSLLIYKVIFTDSVCQAFDAVTMVTVTVVINRRHCRSLADCYITFAVISIAVGIITVAATDVCVIYWFCENYNLSQSVIKIGFYRGIPEFHALSNRQLLACKEQRW